MAQPPANNTLICGPVPDDKAEAQEVMPAVSQPQIVDLKQDAAVVPDEREPTYLMQGLLCAIASLEGADTQLLGACMMAMQEDLHLELMDISYMTISQMVLTNLAAPFWGMLADRGILRRKTILLLGALGQGLVTIALAFVNDMLPMVFIRALNGVLLAALRPISNGIVGDVTAEPRRGKIFGRIQAALLLGMFVTIMTIVPMARQTVLGFHGWRVAFVIVGLVSVLVSALVMAFMQEPPRAEASDSASGGGRRCAAIASEVVNVVRFFRMPTFCVMVMQGVFGTIPWTVMGYMTLFLQKSGMKDEKVAILTGMGPVTGAAGNILGGLVADALASRLHLHGRPLSAQISVGIGVPLIYAIFMGVPVVEGGNFPVHLALNIAFGLLATWAQSGTNLPILSHIVPSEARGRIMAWESAVENSIANAVGPLVVALLAEKAFGYKLGEDDDSQTDIASAEALGKALAATECIPWIITFFAYGLLHWSYPRDVRRLEGQEKAATAAAAKTLPSEEPAADQKNA